MRDRIGIRHFKSPLLQIVAEIKKRAADEERALRVDHDAYVGRMDEDVPWSRSVNQIHFVLQAGAPPANNRDAKRAVGTTLFLEQRG